MRAELKTASVEPSRCISLPDQRHWLLKFSLANNFFSLNVLFFSNLLGDASSVESFDNPFTELLTRRKVVRRGFATVQPQRP